MPNELVRGDRILLNYLCRVEQKEGHNDIPAEKVYKDMNNVQKKGSITLFDIHDSNGEYDSRDIRRELTHLNRSEKIDLHRNDSGDIEIELLGFGKLSGMLTDPPEELDEQFNKLSNGHDQGVSQTD
ncbi:hypothetical protein [Haloarcula japonica]|uniref:Uncharacterized protein n=1 Tax=Haloarcula japonica (strain ATCC 49778 / DSM 6131 / JCM 7785 / NBRC 101032 / NCIMB 13157 / TR-1) TaxID=1227453 RepID=M0LQQ0_HALJT|nr:hypothetical protein [Haloarcula japonica]EMA34375.1 hypothetical protein C444_02531 [Haloarcula japonica DSM 6131]